MHASYATRKTSQVPCDLQSDSVIRILNCFTGNAHHTQHEVILRILLARAVTMTPLQFAVAIAVAKAVVAAAAMLPPAFRAAAYACPAA